MRIRLAGIDVEVTDPEKVVEASAAQPASDAMNMM